MAVWEVIYNGDYLPETAAKPFTKINDTTIATIASGILNLFCWTGDCGYYRTDVLPFTNIFVVQFKTKFYFVSDGSKGQIIIRDSNNKEIIFEAEKDGTTFKIRIIGTTTGEYIVTCGEVGIFLTYQIEIKSNKAKLFINEIEKISDIEAKDTLESNRIEFGHNGTAETSYWDEIKYGYGEGYGWGDGGWGDYGWGGVMAGIDEITDSIGKQNITIENVMGNKDIDDTAAKGMYNNMDRLTYCEDIDFEKEVMKSAIKTYNDSQRLQIKFLRFENFIDGIITTWGSLDNYFIVRSLMSCPEFAIIARFKYSISPSLVFAPETLMGEYEITSPVGGIYTFKNIIDTDLYASQNLTLELLTDFPSFAQIGIFLQNSENQIIVETKDISAGKLAGDKFYLTLSNYWKVNNITSTGGEIGNKLKIVAERKREIYL